MTVIDSHHHLWDTRVREYPFLAAPELATIRRPYELADLRDRCFQNDVSQTVLVQTVSSVDETQEFLHVAGQSDGLIGGVVGWVDLESAGVQDTVDALRAGAGGDRLVGVRHQAQEEPDDAWLARRRVLDGLRRIADAGLCFDLLVKPSQYAAAVAAARAVPGGRFVLDHIGKPDIYSDAPEAWADGICPLAELPNVSCKLSGLVSLGGTKAATAAELRPFTDRMLELFGPSRLMVGSDWPVCEAVAEYGEVLTLAEQLTSGLSHEEHERLFGDTARDFYGLNQLGGPRRP